MASDRDVLSLLAVVTTILSGFNLGRPGHLPRYLAVTTCGLFLMTLLGA